MENKLLPLKAQVPILFTLLGMVTEVNLLQSEKAYEPIDVTESPMMYSCTCFPKILLMLEFDKYVAATISLASIFTEVKPLQPEYLQVVLYQ